MKRIYISLIIVVLFSGCNIYKKYERPAVETAGVYGKEIAPIASMDSTTLASKSWRELFTDVKLQQLLEIGIANNVDLQTARLRVEQATASLRTAKLAYIPSFALAPQGTVSSFDNHAASQTYQLPLTASWEVDVFGKIRNAKLGAESALMQTEEYKQAVQTAIISAIANTYYTLLMLDQQVVITNQTVVNWKESIRVMEVMKKAGMQNEAGISRAKANLYQIEASLFELNHALVDVENQLSLLLMQPIQSIERGKISDQSLPIDLNVGYPIQLLSNRPDVRSSEYALSQSFYGLNVSRASLYPSLRLNGSVGWTNAAGAAIVNPGSMVASAIGSLTQPLFSGGALRANVKIAKAEYEIALLAFEQSILNAGAEVNDALRQCQTARHKKNLRAKQIMSLSETINSTKLLMEHGSTTYLEVLTAQQALLQAELVQVGDWLEEAQGVVNLYHALGGGAE